MKVSLSVTNPAEREQAIAALHRENLDLQSERERLLRAAGYPSDYAEIRYECPKCGDTGYTEDGAMCSCMREKLITASLSTSGLSSLLHNERFDNFSLDYYRNDERAYRTMSVVYRTLQNYAETFTTGDASHEPSGNLLLMGGTGLGKTHLSTAVAGVVLGRGFDVLYTSAVDLLAAFETERFGTDYRPDTRTVSPDRFFRCDLLIIDDLGTEVSNQFTVSCLYNVINTRLNLRLPTIISTNLLQDELRRRYWDRITSRLFGDYQILLFLGTDVRAQKIRQ